MTTPPSLENDAVLDRILAAERATADRPSKAEPRLDLASRYRQAGLSRAAEAELARLLVQFPKHPMVLAIMLDLLCERRAISPLENLVSMASAVRGPPPTALRLAMARASAALGRLQQAAVQLAALAAEDDPGERAWGQIAEFVRLYPPTDPLPAALRARSADDAADRLPPMAHYAILRTQLDYDRGAALSALDRIDLDQVADADTVADIALQSLRLGRWERAIHAARKAVATCAEPVPSARALISACSFAGQFAEAESARRMLPAPSGCIELTRGQAEAVVGFAATAGEAPACWGVLCEAAAGTDQWQVRRHTLDGILTGAASDSPPELGEAAAARVVSSPAAPPQIGGAVDLLEDLDWGTPHLMVQRDGGGDILHAFVPISAVDVWAWEEVPLAVAPAAAGFREAFRFLSAGEPASVHGTEGTEALWRRVERELCTIRLPGKDRK